MRRVTYTGLLVSVVLVLCVSCQADGVDIPPGSDDLKRCKVDKKVPVEELTTPELKGCNPEGVTVVFPDGIEKTTRAVGVGSGLGSTRWPERYYTLTNWGVPGIAAAVVDDGSLKIWGRLDAMKLQVEAINQSSSLRG